MARRIPYKLIIRQRRGYLYIEYAGTELTLGAMLDMVNISAQAARTLEAKRVLLVRNIPLMTSDADRRLFASVIRESVPKNVRYAMVDKYGNDPAASARGLEVLRTAGWDVTQFDTVEAAEQWLRADDVPNVATQGNEVASL